MPKKPSDGGSSSGGDDITFSPDPAVQGDLVTVRLGGDEPAARARLTGRTDMALQVSNNQTSFWIEVPGTYSVEFLDADDKSLGSIDITAEVPTAEPEAEPV